MNVIKFTCNTTLGYTFKSTYFELERFGNDCLVKVIGKNQVKKVINLNLFLQTIASMYHMLARSDLYEQVGVQ